MEIGDTMQHELPKMPNDMIEVPLYVEDVNKAFECDTTSNETYSQTYWVLNMNGEWYVYIVAYLPPLSRNRVFPQTSVSGDTLFLSASISHLVKFTTDG